MNHCDHGESWAGDVGKLRKMVNKLEERIDNQRKEIKLINKKLKNQRKTICKLEIKLKKEVNHANVRLRM